LADGAIGVEKPFAQFVESDAPMKNKVVAEFDLREEQSVVATSLLALCLGEEMA
jgi:hypothetical protein